MLTEIRYVNFKVLANATLRLAPFTLIVGPNGSGKSTAIRALSIGGEQPPVPYQNLVSVGLPDGAADEVKLEYVDEQGRVYTRRWQSPAAIERARAARGSRKIDLEGGVDSVGPPVARVFNLDSDAIAAPTQVRASAILGGNGGGLVGVLQELRDQHPERFDALLDELRRWLPDFDNILFQTPQDFVKSLSLRTRIGRHAIPSSSLSQGTLFALALLTIAYLPTPPGIIAIEEPDRGMHPRLLRDVRDALYRLAYPDSVGVDRPAVQVIATSHSPFMVDLFKDHPEEVVLTQKEGLHASFQRLVDQPHWEEIVQDAALGDLWYSGVLGGVPTGT